MVSLTPAELARYSRHVLLPEIGKAGQSRLKAARVLVIGAGGLGSPAALYLAAAGVGTLGIADFDIVELSNLHRQLLHSDEAIGSLKTASAADRLQSTNPLVQVVQHADGINAANAVEIFSNYDVVVDGTDNFASRYLHNDAAILAKVPLVYGSIYRFEGQVSVFAPIWVPLAIAACSPPPRQPAAFRAVEKWGSSEPCAASSAACRPWNQSS